MRQGSSGLWSQRLRYIPSLGSSLAAQQVKDPAVVSAVAQVQFPAWELPHAAGAVKKKKNSQFGAWVRGFLLSRGPHRAVSTILQASGEGVVG